jgi:tetratricopeptide (TPR) repeat protein
LTSGLILLLLTKPEYLSYPSFLRSFVEITPPDGLSLASNPMDISGLPQEYEQFVQECKDVAYAIRAIAPDGKNVAIFDVNDTLLCYAANACPWRPCAFIFQMALTKQSVADVRSDLIQRPPNYVVTRGQNAPRAPSCDFIWAPLYEVVTNRYELVQTVGPYEIWAVPQSALANCRAAEALLAKGQAAEAIARYTEALRMEPDLSVALNNLAWIRAAHSQAQFRNGAEAVRLAERACRVTGYQQPMLVGTLAAAYAEAGRFDEATAMAEKARALALAAGQNELAEKDQQLVELFKAHQPCREPAAVSGGK